jgi:galactose oxidase-like protein/HYR domain-containing protein
MPARPAASLMLFAVAASVMVTSSATVSAAGSQPNWGLQSPTQSPAGRSYAGMAYDSARARTVMFGGANSSSNTFGDTWEWDGAHWTSFFATPSPAPSIGPGMAYDSRRGVTVLLDNNSHTWEWNGAGWVQRTTANAPSPRVWTSMVFDAARGVMVLFDGSSRLGDTWTYDGNDWTKMSPLNSPSPRYGTSMAFDSARKVVVLFGGWNGPRLNDTWEWDGSNWTQRTPANSPSPRFFHTMAYDASVGATVMFGGDHVQPFFLGPENDTWMWDGTNWTRDWTAAAPSPRAGQSMAYQSTLATDVLFGGSDELNPGTFPTDTWELGSQFVTPTGSPAAHFSANNMSFGTVSGVGVTSGTGHLLVINSGTGPLVFSSIAASGDFVITSNDCPIAPSTLAAGAYCIVLLTFTPSACATSIGSLTFTDNGPGGSQSVGLEGGVLNSTCDGDLLIFPPNDVTVAASTPSGAVVNFGLPGANENATSITCSPASGSTFPVGNTAVTCQVTDPDDVTSTVTGTFHVSVTYADTDLALTGVPADISVSTMSGGGAVVDYSTPSALDEEATSSAVSCNPASGSTFPIGTTTVTCTATDTDDAPTSVTATFRITVLDNDLAFTAPPRNVVANATDPSGAIVNYSPPVAADEDLTAPAVTCLPSSGSTFPIGTSTVTCTATDSDDTPSTITTSFQVTVNDTDLAFSGVPANIVRDATTSAGTPITFAPPTAVDEEGAPAVTCDHVSGSMFPIGTSAVTCSASDSDDTPNTITASFLVTVNDTDLALTAAPANIVGDAVTSAGTAVTFTPPTAVDEEGAPAVSCDHASGSTFPIGITTVTCRASDADDSPGVVTASFTVTIRDTDLSLPGPADITAVATSSAGAAVTYPAPVAVDEDGARAATCDHPSGSTFPVGATLVTCTATDSDDSPSSATIGFLVNVIPDMSLAMSVSPRTAGVHSTVMTTASVTDIGAVTRKVTISYEVTFTDSSGTTAVMASDKATVTVNPSQTVSRSFAFTVRNGAAAGVYVVAITSSDTTGSVTQSSSFVVS